MPGWWAKRWQGSRFARFCEGGRWQVVENLLSATCHLPPATYHLEEEALMKRLVVLISGSGTNLQAILDAIQSGVLDARIEMVISNRKDAFGLARAEQAGVATLYFPLKPYTDSKRPRADCDAKLSETVSG